MEEAVHADCRVFQVLRRRFRHPQRQTEDDFFAVDSPDWAVALAQTPSGHWVLVRQFRFGLRDLTWEFPSGCIQPGEDPALAATRELTEETGYRADSPHFLGQVSPNPAIMDNTCHFFLFPNARPTGQTAWDPHEEIEVATRTHAEVLGQATNGEMVHSLMHAGLFLYHAWLDQQNR